MFSRKTLLLCASLFCFAEGCAHGPATRNALSGPVSKVEMEEIQLEVSRDGGKTELVAYDAATLFEEGGQQLDADRYAEAAQSYDRIVKNFSDSPYVTPALFNAGLSYEGLGRFEDAIDRYRHVGDGPGKVQKDALLRMGACQAELGRWPASIDVFERALRRDDLNLSERIETMSRRALGLFEINDLQVAEAGFRDAVSYYQAHKAEERIESGFFVAMSQFYQGYISHRRFRELPLRLPQKQLAEDIATLSKAFLSTQDKYVETIRVKDPMWASAAGYQVGALYRELYDALVKSPLPPELDNELKKLVYGEMLKTNLRTLLEKGQHILQKNIDMAGRVGIKNGWVEKSSAEIEEISKLLAALDTQEIGPAATTPTGKHQEVGRVPPTPRTAPRTRVNPQADL